MSTSSSVSFTGDPTDFGVSTLATHIHVNTYTDAQNVSHFCKWPHATVSFQWPILENYIAFDLVTSFGRQFRQKCQVSSLHVG